jgi:hypothetical protein
LSVFSGLAGIEDGGGGTVPAPAPVPVLGIGAGGGNGTDWASAGNTRAAKTKTAMKAVWRLPAISVPLSASPYRRLLSATCGDITA